jgi:zinc/manganese transport system permease protein
MRSTDLVANGFSWKIWSDFNQIWQYSFMRNAFIAGTMIAVVGGVVGYFVVLRRLSFASHALSHVGFAGAAGAVLVNINPLVGLMVFTSGGGIAMASLGRKASQRDVQIGTVLAFMLGLGVLFINLYKGYATEAYSILFGEVLGISRADVMVTLVAGFIVIMAILSLYRRLVFSSLNEDVAEAKGISVLSTGMIFMLILAIATSIAVQVVGILLIFALMVTPAATAQRLARTPIEGILISVLIALLSTWVGLFISFYISFPVSFFIVSIVFSVYLLTRLFEFARSRSYKLKQTA